MKNIFALCQVNRSPCLYNITDDPCEYRNLAATMTDIVATLQEKLQEYQESMVEPRNKPKDNAGLPIYHDGVWGPWETLDDSDFIGLHKIPPVHCNTPISGIQKSTIMSSSTTTRSTSVDVNNVTQRPFNTPVTEYACKSDNCSVFSISAANKKQSHFNWWSFPLFCILLIISSMCY